RIDALEEQPYDTTGEHLGLARTGARHDLEARRRAQDRAALRLAQPVREREAHHGGGHDASAAGAMRKPAKRSSSASGANVPSLPAARRARSISRARSSHDRTSAAGSRRGSAT